jgi:hypothetical protein
MSYSAVIQPMQAAIPAQGRVCRFSMPTGGDSVLFADRSVDFSRLSVAPDEALEHVIRSHYSRPTPAASDGISGLAGRVATNELTPHPRASSRSQARKARVQGSGRTTKAPRDGHSGSQPWWMTRLNNLRTGHDVQPDRMEFARSSSV